MSSELYPKGGGRAIRKEIEEVEGGDELPEYPCKLFWWEHQFPKQIFLQGWELRTDQ